ncbi:DUF397 domain-containing protein [Streptomyces albus]|uniref:DUF397 domain-containing protein n=1 Tax=Streptomyces albus TaxID=1888 RepID=UPI0036F684F6
MCSTEKLAWRKSSYSNGQSACVEVAVLPEGVAARDSKRTDSPELVFPAASWSAFVAALSDDA